jgi:hypothetical protein
MSIAELSDNIKLAYKARKFNIKLDVNDITQSYDFRKVGKKGLTLL